jgi:ketosteroid isomerase-like protein
MKTCPYCSEAVGPNHLFCRSCGASLRLPEYERAFCPHCGARVSAKQEFCHECHWHLVPGEPEGQVPAGKPLSETILQQISRRPVVSAMAATLGAVFLLVVGWLFFSGSSPVFSPSPPELKPPEPLPGLSASPPPAKLFPAPRPDASRDTAAASKPLRPEEAKIRLQAVLDDIKEAQLSQDIDRFMQIYASDFPNLEDKREKILRTWQFYDFSKLNYTIEELKLLNSGKIMAQVAWEIEITSKEEQQANIDKQTFHVWLSKAADGWRISNIERIGVQ